MCIHIFTLAMGRNQNRRKQTQENQTMQARLHTSPQSLERLGDTKICVVDKKRDGLVGHSTRSLQVQSYTAKATSIFNQDSNDICINSTIGLMFLDHLY